MEEGFGLVVTRSEGAKEENIEQRHRCTERERERKGKSVIFLSLEGLGALPAALMAK